MFLSAPDDHACSLDALVAAVPDAEVIMSARDAGLMAGDLTLDADEPQDKIGGGLKGQKTVPTGELVDGGMVGSLRAIFTPGHTPGHFSMIDERDGMLYGGDVGGHQSALPAGQVRHLASADMLKVIDKAAKRVDDRWFLAS
ncbi:MAG: hypothetical protein JHD02_05475 [Thermoleophilaceae bacterium]|nr:hypothetical protein [Thermoleophilaceae bacterium]